MCWRPTAGSGAQTSSGGVDIHHGDGKHDAYPAGDKEAAEAEAHRIRSGGAARGIRIEGSGSKPLAGAAFAVNAATRGSGGELGLAGINLRKLLAGLALAT
jgi:hypothetical protein